MRAFFPYSNTKNQKFQTTILQKTLTFVKHNPGRSKFNEKPNGLELVIKPIEFVDEALEVINSINKAEMAGYQ